MANTKSTQHEIDLTSELNLNKFKADIKPYNGFNERNSPYYGGALSPLFCKNENVNDTTQFYKGHKYHTDLNGLYRDGQRILQYSQQGFEKTVITKIIENEEVEVLNYYDDDNYVYRRYADNIVYVISGGTNHAIFMFSLYVNSRFYASINSNIVYFVVQGTTSCFYGRSNDATVRHFGFFQPDNHTATNWGFMNLDYLYIDNTHIQVNTTFYDNINHRYMLTACTPSNAKYYVASGTTSEYLILFCGNFLMDYSVSSGGLYYYNYNTYKDSTGLIGLIKAPYNNNNTIYINDHLCLTKFDDGYGTSESTTYNDTLSIDSVKPNSNGFTYTDILTNYTIKTYNRVEKTRPVMRIASNTDATYQFKVLNVFNSDFQYLEVWNTASETKRIGYSKNVQSNGTQKPVYDSQGHQIGVTLAQILGPYSTFTDDNNNVYKCSAGNIIDRKGSWHIIYSPQGAVLGISFGGSSETNYSGTLLTSWGSVASDKPVYEHHFYNFITYFDTDLGKWVKIEYKNIGEGNFTIIDKYIVVNTSSYYNCINLETLEKEHWADDWNNFLFFTVTSGHTYNQGSNVYYDEYWANDGATSYSPRTIAGGKNINWLEDSPSTIKPAPIVVYTYGGSDRYISWGCDGASANNVGASRYNLDIYINSKYAYTLYEYGTTGVTTYCRRMVKPGLLDTTYPGDAVRNNLPILFDVVQGPLDTTLVNFGSNVSFFLIYYDNINRYQYYNSSITEFEDFFVIQGQTYGIARDKIYSLAYANGAIQSSLAIAPLEGLIFIGNTIYNAYFYSPTVRAIYSFGADNNLQMFTQADTITGVTGSTYLVGTGSLIIGTPECTYVLNERFGIYRLPIQNMKYAAQLDGQVVIVWVNNTSDLRAQYITYEPLTNYTKQNVVLDTAFYGAGSNVVSVNDCWYIRVTDTGRGEGEIKLAVSTLTDVGRTTEERTFKIKAKDWDELTDTVYIRFQPKLQRAVGVSLHLESPFKVGYIGVGATPETLQLNKGTI